MTTKPKARKFRIKRSPGGVASGPLGVPAATAAPQGPQSTAPASSGAAPQGAAPVAAPSPAAALQPAPDTAAPVQPDSAPPAQSGEVASAAQVAGENTIDAIRKEGLTGRQLRMARRVAQKNGLAPTSDFDAVRLLRARGVDPFQRSNMLELVVPNAAPRENDGAAPAPGGQSSAIAPRPGGGTSVQLPNAVAIQKAQLPATEISPAERRAQDIQAIQREIMLRRRKKLALLLVRLTFFVFLPTALAGYYFYKVATPMYATESEFLIIQSEGAGGGSALGGLLPTQFATNQDAIGVQAYLESKEAMLRLDKDVGFKSHFEQDWIDPIQRLENDPTDEDAYSVYTKNVKIGYDPTEGLIRMEVAAADPDVSASFSERLIGYAEERVNDLSSQKREDQMRDAREGFERADADRRAAQEALVRLQIEGSTLDPEAVIGALRGQISQVETQLIEKEIELASLLNNSRPNQSRVDAAEGEIEVLETQLEKLNNRMTDVSKGENSLAELAARIQIAQADLLAADATLQTARQAMEAARIEASRQVRYLTVAVRPIAPDEPSYPRAFENTILAFLVFAGVYLMLSITASILREQITS